jgi:hypothetical protein
LVPHVRRREDLRRDALYQDSLSSSVRVHRVPRHQRDVRLCVRASAVQCIQRAPRLWVACVRQEWVDRVWLRHLLQDQHVRLDVVQDSVMFRVV